MWPLTKAYDHMGGVPKMMGFPNNHGVFLLQMIILGCEMGVPPFKETPIYDPNWKYITCND